MSNWYLNAALVDLRNELNSAYPNRAKVSDGSVGDLAHSQRVSDHNPDRTPPNVGEVRAIDVTQWDPGTPLDPKDDVAEALAEFLRAKKDSRIKYVIWRGRMFSSYSTSKYAAWTWRPYTGSNGHFHHVHISVNEGAKGGKWGFARNNALHQWLPMGKGETDASLYAKGGLDNQVSEHQLILKALSIRWGDKALDPGAIDGKYGSGTEKATKRFQERHSGFLRDVKHPDYKFWRGPFTGYCGGRTIAAERWWNNVTA